MADGDDYKNKGFICDYGKEFKRNSFCGVDRLREFDITPYKTMQFE